MGSLVLLLLLAVRAVETVDPTSIRGDFSDALRKRIVTVLHFDVLAAPDDGRTFSRVVLQIEQLARPVGIEADDLFRAVEKCPAPPAIARRGEIDDHVPFRGRIAVY